MESALLTVIKHWLSLGGGYVIALVFIVLYILERKHCHEMMKEFDAAKDKLFDRLFASAGEQARVMAEVSGVLKENDKTLDNVQATLNIMASRRNDK